MNNMYQQKVLLLFVEFYKMAKLGLVRFRKSVPHRTQQGFPITQYNFMLSSVFCFYFFGLFFTCDLFTKTKRIKSSSDFSSGFHLKGVPCFPFLRQPGPQFVLAFCLFEVISIMLAWARKELVIVAPIRLEHRSAIGQKEGLRKHCVLYLITTGESIDICEHL